MKKMIKNWQMAVVFLTVFISFGVLNNAYASDVQSNAVIAEKQITTDSSDQYSPAIYGDKIVWQDNRNGWGIWDIYMYDLTKSEEIRITSTGHEFNPSIYGDKIVWNSNRNGNWDIYMYDLTKSEEVQITSNGINQNGPVIYGDKILWNENTNAGLEVFMYDLTKSEETQNVTNSNEDQVIAIYGDKIVLSELHNGRWGLAMYDLSNSKKTLFTSTGSGEATIYGNNIAYHDASGGVDSLNVYNLSTSKTIQITNGNPGFNGTYSPSIYGDKVVWSEARNDSNNPFNTDVFMYDLDTSKETRITSNSAIQSNPRIYGDRIVWYDSRNGASNMDIYLATLDSSVVISKWNTTKTSSGSSNSNQIKLPLDPSGTYNFTINWGDGTSNTITSFDQDETTHTYATEGEYEISIRGTVKGFRFNNFGDKLKILEISQWGSLNLGNAGGYFYGTKNLNITAADILDLTGTTDMSYAFAESGIATVPSMNIWDMSAVTNMKYMFYADYSFNQLIGNWDVSNVTNMYGMLGAATSFNQPIGEWKVDNVTDMTYMFFSDIAFNQPIDKWNVSKVTSMYGMFNTARKFNQPIGIWKVDNVSDMGYMFYGATAFNRPLGDWNVSKVNNMELMFDGVTLSTENYNNLLVSWSKLSLPQSNVKFSAGNSKYDLGSPAVARQKLVDNYGWNIADGGSTNIEEPCSMIDLSETSPSINIPIKQNLIIITHGWNGSAYDRVKDNGDKDPSWVSKMRDDICNNIDRETTTVGVFDWEIGAGTGPISPTHPTAPTEAYYNAGKNGMQNSGNGRGEKLFNDLIALDLTNNTHIHLIAHSAGSNVIQTAVDMLAEHYRNNLSDAPSFVQLTFLDAFAPEGEGERYGDLHEFKGYAEQYVDMPTDNAKDFLYTNIQLPNATNFDVTYLTGESSRTHNWPYEFYDKSVADSKYLLPVSGDENEFKLGFPFSVESNNFVEGSDKGVEDHKGQWCIVTNVSEPYRRCLADSKEEKRDVIITNQNSSVSISGAGKLVDVSQFIGVRDGGGWGGELPEITMNVTDIATVLIDKDTVITSDSGWNGIFSTPIARDIYATESWSLNGGSYYQIGGSISGIKAFDLGIDGQNINFSKAVKVILSGTSGMKDVAYSHNSLQYYSIPDCNFNQMVGENLNGGACKMRGDSGDFIVWTMHFTTFAAYSPEDSIAPSTTFSHSSEASDGWFNADVQVTLSAVDNDGGSGVDKTEYSLDGGTTWVKYDAPFAVSGEGVNEVKFHSTDKAGNTEDIQNTEIKIDKTAPKITINAPADGSQYVLKSTINADWSVTDEVSGIDKSNGTVTSGSPVDTSSVGSKEFTVTAADVAGNSITKTIKYNIVYNFGGFQSPIKDGKSFNGGSTIPVTFQLTDASKDYVSNAVVSIEVDGKAASASGNSNDGSSFRYDTSANQYVFNLSAKNNSLGSGAHTLKITLDDGTTYSQNITIK